MFYEVVRLIADTGYRQIWEVKDSDTGIKYALKIGDNLNQEEIKIMKQIDSIHVIKCHSVIDVPSAIKVGTRITPQSRRMMPGRVGAIMDLGIADLSNPSPCNNHMIMKSTAEGLVAMHEAGYIHCDVKPNNILQVPRGGRISLVLCDFGISRTVSTMKRDDSLICTIPYRPPEVALRLVDRWSSAVDIWSLGLMMLIRLGGQIQSSSDNQKWVQKLQEWYETSYVAMCERVGYPLPLQYLREMWPTYSPKKVARNRMKWLMQADINILRLTVDCLDPKPVNRPSARIIVTRLSNTP